MSIDYLFCCLRELMWVITDTFPGYYVPNVEIWHIDLSKQAKLKYPQHNNFIGKLESN